MKDYGKMKQLLCKELDEYKDRDKLTMSDLEIVHKLTDTVKNIYKIEMYEEEIEGEHSHRSHMAERGSSYGGGRRSYDDEGSYRRGGSYDSGYGMGISHSDGMEQTIGKLERMMEEADPKQRELFRRFIGQLQNV